MQDFKTHKNRIGARCLLDTRNVWSLQVWQGRQILVYPKNFNLPFFGLRKSASQLIAAPQFCEREPLKQGALVLIHMLQPQSRFLYRRSASSSRLTINHSLPISLGVGDGLDSGWMGRFVQMHSVFFMLKKPVLNHSECLTRTAINENCNSHMTIMTLINSTFSVEDWHVPGRTSPKATWH
jgi:hypothetical protein